MIKLFFLILNPFTGSEDDEINYSLFYSNGVKSNEPIYLVKSEALKDIRHRVKRF